jgi:hypothetical protein
MDARDYSARCSVRREPYLEAETLSLGRLMPIFRLVLEKAVSRQAGMAHH